uniref:Putative secreted protein n=1 Tax=Ixodes ricinus TaxID=34613 RepID=A0A6B0U3N0_IXORI
MPSESFVAATAFCTLGLEGGSFTHTHTFFFCQGTSTLQIRQQVVTVSTTSFRVLPISVTKLSGHKDAPTSQKHPSKQTKRHPRGGIDDET